MKIKKRDLFLHKVWKKLFYLGENLFGKKWCIEQNMFELETCCLGGVGTFWIEAKKTFQKYRWPIIDVSRKSVEETAASIIKIYEISKKNAWNYFSFKKQS